MQSFQCIHPLYTPVEEMLTLWKAQTVNDNTEWHSGLTALVSLVIFLLLGPYEHDLCILSYYNVYSVTDRDYFFRLPSKHLGHIVHGLCFTWVNVSSIRCRRSFILYAKKVNKAVSLEASSVQFEDLGLVRHHLTDHSPKVITKVVIEFMPSQVWSNVHFYLAEFFKNFGICQADET